MQARLTIRAAVPTLRLARKFLVLQLRDSISLTLTAIKSAEYALGGKLDR
jgi:hypothetical protein